jgi:hypothetical protein
MSFSKFNESAHCLTYSEEVIHAFDGCREESFEFEPALAVATTPPPPVADGVTDAVNSTPPGDNEDAVIALQVRARNLTATNATGKVQFTTCFAGAYPSKPCHEMCDDILRASVERGEVCEESCNKMSSCASSCGMEFVYPSAVSSCMGECMGPVPGADDAGTVAPKDVPPCTTTACQYWGLAAQSMDDTAWHLKFALDKADHMMKATSTLRNINEMVTPPPPEEPTPFPWPKLEKRVISYGNDPFAAFSPATPLPENFPEPLAGISTSRKFSSRQGP